MRRGWKKPGLCSGEELKSGVSGAVAGIDPVYSQFVDQAAGQQSDPLGRHTQRAHAVLSHQMKPAQKGVDFLPGKRARTSRTISAAPA